MPVKGTRHDVYVRVILCYVADKFCGVLPVVDRDDEHLRILDARSVQQIRTHGIAEKHLDAKGPQYLELLGLVVENDRLETGRKEDAIDDPPETTVARDDNAACLIDFIGLTVLRSDEARGNQLFEDNEKQRREQHRQRDDQEKLFCERRRYH